MNPPIPYTKANSLPVTIATDDLPLEVSGSVTLNPTNIPLPVTEIGATFTGSVASASDLFVLDMDNYRSVFIQVVGAGTTCTVSYTTSNSTDGPWNAITGLTVTGIGASAPASSSTTAIGLRFAKAGRYFKASVTTYTSGTVSATAYLSSSAGFTTQGSATVIASSTSGVAAHDAAISGNPVRIGARALTANYTAVATGDTADLVTTLVGAQIQKPYAIPETDWSYAAATTGIVHTTTAVTIVAAAAAGLRNYITSISFMSEALGAATELAIRDGAAGAVLWRIKIPITTVIPPTCIVFPSPLKSTAATLLEVVTLTDSVTGGVFFNATGYIAP